MLRTLAGVTIADGLTSKLNGALTTGGNTTMAALNNQSVIYVADQDTDDVFELYASDLDSSFGGGFKVYLPLVLH